MKQLITNRDGRLSTTAFVQFFGFIVLAATLIYSVYLDRDSTPELYWAFAAYCGGLTATKGAVMAYKHNRKTNESEIKVGG